jgi:hypothetical protein
LERRQVLIKTTFLKVLTMEEVGDQLQSRRYAYFVTILLRITTVSLCVCVWGGGAAGGGGCCTPQSGQSAKLFSPVVGIGTPPPQHPQASMPPPHLWFRSGGGATLTCGRGGGGVSIPTREQTLWYSVYLCTVLCTAPLFISPTMFPS